MGARSMWTPNGEIPLDEKGVIPIANRTELALFAGFGDLSAKYNFTVVCKECNSALIGQNNKSSTGELAVSCNCRTWIWKNGR